ncbi:MAG: hypothetical protein QOJ12_2591 [Thermoleophilales bacterium]|jgi:hypothetical protein|nr:hypothetical protein [Thermoleophilales bacterium]
MRLLPLVILAVLAFAPAADAKSTCSATGSKTVASNSSARVYTVKSGRADYGDVLLGCLRSNGKRFRLAENYDDGLYVTSSFSKVRLNGRFVGWQVDNSDVSCKADCPPGYQTATSALALVDLSSRRRRTIDAAAVGNALVVSRTGGLAWVGQGQGALVVYTAPAGSREYTPADSGDIDPSSLSLRGSVLSWRNAGVAKTATLR